MLRLVLILMLVLAVSGCDSDSVKEPMGTDSTQIVDEETEKTIDREALCEELAQLVRNTGLLGVDIIDLEEVVSEKAIMDDDTYDDYRQAAYKVSDSLDHNIVEPLFAMQEKYGCN